MNVSILEQIEEIIYTPSTYITLAVIWLIYTIIRSYSNFMVSLYKTYDYHTTGGSNCYYNDIYFKTWRELFKHAIPFYYSYLKYKKMYKAFKQLK